MQPARAGGSACRCRGSTAASLSTAVCLVSFRRSERDDELEAGAVRHRRLVDDVSAVGPCISPGDREPEARAPRFAPRPGAASESVEQAGDELASNALPPI